MNLGIIKKGTMVGPLLQKDEIGWICNQAVKRGVIGSPSDKSNRSFWILEKGGRSKCKSRGFRTLCTSCFNEFTMENTSEQEYNGPNFEKMIKLNENGRTASIALRRGPTILNIRWRL